MKNMSIKKLLGLLTCSAALVLTGCGGGSGATVAQPATTPAGKYTIGGTVTGLTGGGMVLQNNGGDDVQVPNDGSGTYTGAFPTPLATGATYLVTIPTQPSGQSCQLSNASGTVGTANVTNITAVCSNLQVGSNFTVGFNVLGLTGTGLRLFNNLGDQTAPIIPNGGAPVSGTFSIPLATGALYSVTISNSVPGQSCSVTNANGSGNGTIASANITGITITCIADSAIGYDLSVNVSGLVGNTGLTLQNAGKNTTAVSANGPKTFSTKVSVDDPYVVTVASSPVGELCKVTNGGGLMPNANVSGINIVCRAGVPAIYAVNNGGNNIVTYSPTNPGLAQVGAIVPVFNNGFVNASGPVAIALGATGKHAYTLNSSSGSISQYDVSPTDGSLTFSAGISGVIPIAGTQLTDIVIDPLGRKAYVLSTANTIVQYDVTPDNAVLTAGNLIDSAAPNVVVPGQVTGLRINSSGTFAYTFNLQGMFHIYAIAIDGSMGTAPIQSILRATSIEDVAIATSDKRIYWMDSGNMISWNIIATDGKFTGTSSSISIPGNSSNLKIHPTGSFLYYYDGTNHQHKSFDIQPDGSLTNTHTVAGFGDGVLTFNPAGDIMYVLNNAGNKIYVYDIESNGKSAQGIPNAGVFTLGISPVGLVAQ